MPYNMSYYQSMDNGKETKSSKIINSYWDINVDPKHPASRKGKILLNNKIYRSGRDKLLAAGLPESDGRNTKVKLKFHTKQSEPSPDDSASRTRIVMGQIRASSQQTKFRLNLNRKSLAVPDSEIETPLNRTDIRSIPKSSSHKTGNKIQICNDKGRKIGTHVRIVTTQDNVQSTKNKELMRHTTAPTPISKIGSSKSKNKQSWSYIIPKKTRFKARNESVRMKVTDKSFLKVKNKVKIKPDIYQRFYNRWNEFKKMPQYDLDKPSVLISGPYIAEKSKQVWLIFS